MNQRDNFGTAGRLFAQAAWRMLESFGAVRLRGCRGTPGDRYNIEMWTTAGLLQLRIVANDGFSIRGQFAGDYRAIPAATFAAGERVFNRATGVVAWNYPAVADYDEQEFADIALALQQLTPWAPLAAPQPWDEPIPHKERLRLLRPLAKTAIQVGRAVTCRYPKEAYYSGYGEQPECWFMPGMIGVVGAVDVPCVNTSYRLYAGGTDSFVCVDFKHPRTAQQSQRVALYYSNIVPIDLSRQPRGQHGTVTQTSRRHVV